MAGPFVYKMFSDTKGSDFSEPFCCRKYFLCGASEYFFALSCLKKATFQNFYYVVGLNYEMLAVAFFLYKLHKIA